MANSNAPFDDFLELDLLDTTITNNNNSDSDMFSFFFGNEDLNVASALNSTLSALDDPLDLSVLNSLSALGTVDPLAPTQPNNAEQLSSDNNDTKRTQEQSDIQLLLDMNRKLQEQLKQQQLKYEEEKAQMAVAADPLCTTTTTNIDNSVIVAHLTRPIQPTVTAIPQAEAPATSTQEPSATSIATAAAAANAQIAVLVDTSKTTAAIAHVATQKPAAVSPPASAAIKRPSPEPAPAARKVAKTESLAAKKPTPSPKTTKSSDATPSVAPLTSPVNTTLSAATLQFLLQQQMQTPLVPQLFTGRLTREEIEETLARLLESTKHLLLSAQEATIKEDSPTAESEEEEEMEEMEETESEQPAGQTHGLKTQPGIKTDDIPSSKDLKKMTSKERRQLRNKISARNFRVRRKEYIGQLEGQVEQHKTEARHLREAVTVVHSENNRLKQELDEVKRQLAQSTIASASTTITPQQSLTSSTAALSNENQSLLTSILSRTAFNATGKSNVTLTIPRPQSPSLTPNLKKDVPYSSSVNGSSWKDKNPIFVHTTLVPEIRMGHQFQFGQKAVWSKEDEMWDRPWLSTERTPKELSKLEKNPFFLSGVVHELMQTFASATLNMMPLPEVESLSTALVQDIKATVKDYESDKRMSEALEWEMQRELCAQVEAMAAIAQRVDLDQDETQKDLARLLSSSVDGSTSLLSTQEDPNMLEWLYESMMARLVNLDLHGAQEHQTYLPFSEVQFA